MNQTIVDIYLSTGTYLQNGDDRTTQHHSILNTNPAGWEFLGMRTSRKYLLTYPSYTIGIHSVQLRMLIER